MPEDAAKRLGEVAQVNMDWLRTGRGFIGEQRVAPHPARTRAEAVQHLCELIIGLYVSGALDEALVIHEALGRLLQGDPNPTITMKLLQKKDA